MNNYVLNHKNFTFLKDHIIKKVNLQNISAGIMSETGIITCPISETPHYSYVSGEKEKYLEYYKKFKVNYNIPMKKILQDFENLINEKSNYLEGEHKEKYIILNDSMGIMDGHHRAAVLLKNGVTEIPIAIKKKDNQIKIYKDDYYNNWKEWYSPLKVGDIFLNFRTIPNYVEVPEEINSKTRGLNKWNFIIKDNLPDLKGKTVCDIGCNMGLFSYLMIKEKGALKVDGYDRGLEVNDTSNNSIANQDVSQQAYFVKNLLQLQDNTNFDNLNFYPCDLNKINLKELKYDFLFSSNVLYHFREYFDIIIKEIRNNIPEVFLQANHGHGQSLRRFSDIEYHKKVLEKYGYKTKITAPKNYTLPVIYGYK